MNTAESIDAISGTSDGSSGDNDLIGLISSFLEQPDRCDHPCRAPPPSDPEPNRASSAPSSSARVIIFSKDRPWQLQELLRSALGTQAPPRNCGVYVVLRASSPDFHRGYEKVMEDVRRRAGHPRDTVRFLIEDDGAKDTSFSSLLEHALTVDAGAGAEDGVVLFLTDDCLLLEPLEHLLATATGALQSTFDGRGGAYNFVSRLHPGISWCQTRGVADPPPRDEMRYHSLARCFGDLCQGEDRVGSPAVHDGVYFYDRRRCAGEWAYRFDLSGGVYCRGDVVALLEGMTAEEKSGPNMLELRANERLQPTGQMPQEGARKPWTAIATRPLLIVLALNRVQDVFRAPLAPSQEVDNTTHDLDPVSLLALLEAGRHLDVDKYRSRLYNSSHIGDFFLEHSDNACRAENMEKKHDSESAPARPKLSVLVPLHRGPPRAASHALLSIVMQLIEELDLPREGDDAGPARGLDRPLLSPMQIVIVDDRCTDGSIEAIARSCGEALASRGVPFAWHDHRREGPRRDDARAAEEERRAAVSFDVVRAPRAGVACALNHGLRRCRAALVARMDADDVATPRRLRSQLAFMGAHPSFVAVGTSAVLFAARSTDRPRSEWILPYETMAPSTDSYRVLRPSLSLSDPGVLAFSMYFSCAISHPSVMFRKSAILLIGGYDESISCCEDYDLWLRLIDWNSKSITCLPFHGIWHRKHHQSVSAENSTIQKKEADAACHRAIKRLFDLGSRTPPSSDYGSSATKPIDLIAKKAIISTLRHPSSAPSPESLDLAAELLQRLESSFLEKNSLLLSEREIALVKLDCDARIGELATILVTKFGSKGKTRLDRKGGPRASFAWKLWCERCPDRQLERLSLLCHTAAEAK